MLRSFVLLTAGLGIIGIGSEAFARCCHRRNNCCAESSCYSPAATTCGATAPSCCAPTGSSCTAPAPNSAAPIAPVEDVAPPVPGPQASGNQTYRSYSYDPATAPVVSAPAPVYYYAPAPSRTYRADKKMMGRYNQL